MGRMERIAALARIGALSLPCLWAGTYLMPPLNGDVAAILLFAVRMVRGDALYVDIIDVNPPLIFWLNLGPAWLADRLGLSPALVLSAGLLALVPLVLALCRRPLARLAGPHERERAWVLGGAALCALVVVPASNFGQRDALMATLALPYLAVAAARLGGAAPASGEAAGRAALAAVGFLIKPYFLAVPLLIEIAVLWRCGPRAWARRPEPWVMGALGVAYVTAAAVIHPAYFSDVLPLASRYYMTVDLAHAVTIVFGAPERAAALAALGPLALYAVIQGRNPAARVAGLFMIAAAASALVQGKGWPYHLVPLWQGAVVLVALLGSDVLRAVARPALLSRSGEHAVAMVALAAVVIGFGVASPPLRDRLDYAGSFAGRLEPLVAREARGQPVLWLTDAIYPKYPVILYDDVRPAARFMELWLLNSLYRPNPITGPTASASTGARPAMRAPGEMSTDERRFFDTVGQSLERARPALVLIASAAAELNVRSGSFDYLTYFLRHPSFSREWRHYRRIAEVDGTSIYKRQPAPERGSAQLVSER